MVKEKLFEIAPEVQKADGHSDCSVELKIKLALASMKA